MLSLRPTTTPVGGSTGQAPVLRHMNVSQIAPNRVCCNALLAAYARAKPTCWQKVQPPCCWWPYCAHACSHCAFAALLHSAPVALPSCTCFAHAFFMLCQSTELLCSVGLPMLLLSPAAHAGHLTGLLWQAALTADHQSFSSLHLNLQLFLPQQAFCRQPC